MYLGFKRRNRIQLDDAQHRLILRIKISAQTISIQKVHR